MFSNLLSSAMLTTLTANARSILHSLDYRNFNGKTSVSTTILLDPITTIFKLSLLKFKPEFTKIGITGNKIAYYEPVMYQGISRWWSGDSRVDIQYLYLPLLYFSCIRHGYVPSVFDAIESKSEILDRMNKMAIDGLQTLRVIYAKNDINMITNCLDSYIHLLSVNDDKGGFIKNKFDNILNTTKMTYIEFVKEWSVKYISIILNMFDEHDTKHLNMKQNNVYAMSIINTIENMLNTMDDLIDKSRC
jgi:hypothetical protein